MSTESQNEKERNEMIVKRIDFEHGSIPSNILNAAIPMLVAQLLSLLYNIIDRIYIARIPHIGTTALGAVGLCFPIIVIITAFSNLFGSGGAPLFSIRRGENNSRKASEIMNTSYTMVCSSAIVLMVIGFLFARPILRLFGASESALVYAYPYLMIYLLGTLPSMISTGMNSFINAQGYAMTGMTSVAIGAVANCILDPVFIFVFSLGIRGAAIATVISQTLSAAFVLYFLKKRSELNVRFLTRSELSRCMETAKNIVSLGTAGFIMQLTNSLVSICCNNVLSVTGGDIYISVMTIISSVRQLVETPIYAMNEGSSPILSYNYGARQPKRITQTIKLAVCFAECIMLCGLILAEVFPQVLLGVFNASPTMLAMGILALRIIAIHFPMAGFNVISSSAFQALGRGTLALSVSVIRQLVVLVPAAWLLSHTGNVNAVWFAFPIAELVAVTLCAVFMRKCHRDILLPMEAGQKTAAAV